MEFKVYVYTGNIMMSAMSSLVFRWGLRGGDSYSVRIQVLTPIVFNSPRRF